MEVVDISRLFKPENKKVRFAAYCRVSTDSEDQLNSFAAQVKRYKSFEKTHPDYELVDIYADEGITGTSMESRSELQRLMLDCNTGKIDTILVKSVSRMARNTEDLLELTRKFKELDVNIYFEEEKIDTDTMNSEMLLTIKGMAAQQESVSISENLRWSYKKRMESGEFTTDSAPFGYDLVNNMLVVNDEEAQIVRRIFDMYLSGIGTTEIANILNSEGVLRKNKPVRWRHVTVAYVLKNEKYIGDKLLQKTYTPQQLPFKRHINRGEVPMYYVEDNHEAIITKDVFEAAKVRLAAQAKLSENGCKNENPFAGKVICEDCGRKYRRKICRGKAYWICNGQTDEINHCDGYRIREEALYDTYNKVMYKLSTNQGIIKAVIKHLTDIQKKCGGGRERIRQIDIEIANLAEQNTRIAVFNNKKIMKDTEFISKREEILGKIETLRAERKKLVCTDKNEEYIDEVTVLLESLNEFSLEEGFDEDLFLDVVKRVYVVSHKELRFMLIGDLEFSDEIDEDLRCMKNE